MVALAVLERASAIPLSNVGFLRSDAALWSKGIFRRIGRKLRHFGMILGQQVADFFLHGQVVAFTLHLHDDVAVLVDEIAIGPDLGTIGVPDTAIDVGHNRPGKAKTLSGTPDIGSVVAYGELAVMHADHVEAVLVVFGVPALDHGKVTDTVDAGVLPEVDQQHVAAVALEAV